MAKRVALLRDGIVFNVVMAESADEMAALFSCEAIEETEATGTAFVGLGMTNGVFDFIPTPIQEEVEDTTPPQNA